MQFLDDLLTNEITVGFCGVILILALWDLCSFVTAKGQYHRSFKNDVVTIGILGTFVGIFIGLYQFDVDNIDSSIPPLLAGMKTAFATSIAGLFASVIITIVQKFTSSPYAKSGNPIIDKLAEQSRLLKDFLEEHKNSNELLIEQVKNHRLESKDELAKMRGSLNETLKHLSEGASKEIIKALEQVIKDFNQNLTEQFGDNFKQLNEACLKLVDWQENYKETIEETEKRFKAATGAIAETAQSLANIAARNKEFEQFCNNTALSLDTMNSLLENNQQLQEQIKISIDALNSVTQDLKNVPQAFEAVSNKMTENNEKMIDGLEKTNEHLKQHIQISSSRVTQLNADVTAKMTDNNEKMMNALGQTDAQLKEHIENSSKAVKQLNTDMVTATKNLNDSLVSLTEQFGTNYQVFLAEIDKLMQRHNS